MFGFFKFPYKVFEYCQLRIFQRYIRGARQPGQGRWKNMGNQGMQKAAHQLLQVFVAKAIQHDQEAAFLGRPILSQFEVIAYEPGKMVKATSPAGTFPITFTRSVEPSGSGTLVKALIEGDSSGVFKLAEPLMAPMVRKSIEADYARLKALLERE